MDQEVFYPKLVQALVDQHYGFNARQFSAADIEREHDRLSAAIRAATRFGPKIVNAVAGLSIPASAFELHPVFSAEGVQEKLDEIREHSILSCFKFLLSQPIVISVVDADGLPESDIRGLVTRFDEAVIGMLEFTGKMGGIKLGSKTFGATKLSATGIMLFVFFDRASRDRFSTMQGELKVQHFLKKTWVLPWMVDTEAERITRHPGLPIIVPQILDAEKLSQFVFDG